MAPAPSSDGDTVKIVDNNKTFADVPDNYWGAEAVDFAASRELFAGTSATTFAPDTAMTRGMIVTVLARFEGVANGVSNDLSGYTDAGTVSSYAQQAMAWAVEQGIIGGTTATTLSSQSPATRAQVATILMQFIETGIQ